MLWIWPLITALYPNKYRLYASLESPPPKKIMVINRIKKIWMQVKTAANGGLIVFLTVINACTG
jgi:hypothetical protein